MEQGVVVVDSIKGGSLFGKTYIYKADGTVEVREPIVKEGNTVVIKDGFVVGGDGSVAIGGGISCGDQYLNVPPGTDLSRLPSPKGTIVFKGNVTLAKGSMISGGTIIFHGNVTAPISGGRQISFAKK